MSVSIVSRPPPDVPERLRYGRAPAQFGELRLPAGPGPHRCIIAIHGGFWRAKYDLVHLGHLCHALTAAGWATWSIEYRRVGELGGGWPGTFRDVAAGAAYVFDNAKRFDINPAAVFSLGHSAGGHLACWVAALHKIPSSSEISAPLLPFAGAVSLAGVLDLHLAWELGLSDFAVADLLDGSPSERPERYRAADPSRLLPVGRRQLLVHGGADELVPFAISEAYDQRAQAMGEEIMLLRLPEAEHFALIDPDSAAWPTIIAAINRFSWP